MLTYAILGLLRDGRLAHGYELSKRYRALSGVAVASGSFYRQLGRMVIEGYIHGTTAQPGEDARRLPYQITDFGRGTFDAWLLKQHPEDDLTTRGLFLGLLQPQTRQKLLQDWEEHLVGVRASVETVREHALAKPLAEPIDVRPLLHDRRLRMLRAEMDFLRALRRAHSGRRPRPMSSGQQTDDGSSSDPSAAA